MAQLNNARVLLTRFSSPVALAGALRNPNMMLMLGSPASISSVADLAYQNSEVVDIYSSETNQQASLAYIRTTFPQIISSLDEGILDQTLVRFPQIQQRLADDLRLVKEIDPKAEVSSSELIFRILIADGSAEQMGIADYYKIIQTHNLFGTLAAAIFVKDKSLGRQEEKAFINIGQRLLKARRIFEAQLPQKDQGGFLVRFEDREKDYRGRLAQLATRKRIVGFLQDAGADKDRITLIQEEIAADIQYLYLYYPDKLRDIKRVTGYLVGTDRITKWLHEPGAADLTMAEIQDFLHGGTG